MKSTKKNIALAIILILGVLMLFSACRTIVIHSDYDDDDDSRPQPKPHKPEPKPQPKPEPKGIQSGDVIVVRGVISKASYTYYVEDLDSGRDFKLVGLNKSEEQLLYKLIGRSVKVQIKVVSVHSKKSYNAMLIQVY